MLKFLKTSAAALGLAAVATAAAADWAPTGPVKMIIAFAAGGGADTQSRLIAEEVEAATGWSFVPEQVTGRGGMNALLALKDMPNDGTTIAMVVTESMGYNMAAADAGVTPADFTPITTTAGFQMGVVSKSDKGWSSFAEMIEAAKGGQDIRFGTMSPKLSDLAFLLGQAQGVDFNIVQVRGGKAVMNGVQAGDMDVGFMAGIQAKGVESGDLLNLASGLSVPLNQTPDAPMLGDLGVPFSADGYFMFAGPAGMPAEARDAIAAAISAAISTDGNKSNALLNKAFGGPTIIAGDALSALVASDYEAAGKLMEAAQ